MPSMTVKVCIWADGSWCYLSEIDQYNWKSDDFQIVEVPENFSEEEIEIMAAHPQPCIYSDEFMREVMNTYAHIYPAFVDGMTLKFRDETFKRISGVWVLIKDKS